MNDIIGMKFNRLTVIDKSDRKSTKSHSTLYECLCECGSTRYLTKNNLVSGNTKSCGCLKNRHGESRTRLYETWCNMFKRCYDQTNSKYYMYGARGVSICDEWRDYINFRDWARSNGYSDELTIDRIDVNGNYDPSNCRWANLEQQANNTRRNKYIEINGETRTVAQWSREFDIPAKIIYKRLSLGWDAEDLFLPKGSSRKRYT